MIADRGMPGLLPDQDGDGLSEVWMAAYGADFGGLNAGAVYLVNSSGSTTGISVLRRKL